MSNDLINRSELSKEVRKWMNCDERCCQCEYGDGNCFYKDVIFKQPTAYDVDKVVEQIKDIMQDESIRFCDQAVDKAVNIVKAGGIDG